MRRISRPPPAAARRAAPDTDGQHAVALRACELLGRELGGAGLGNPFAAEPVKLKRALDDETMSANDLARELAFAMTLQMRSAAGRRPFSRRRATS